MAGKPAAKEPKRDTRFKKGESGNPKGRPRARWHFQLACRDLSEEMLALLLISARDRNDRDHIRAIELILAYGLGKPTQAVDVRFNLTDVRIMTDAELLDLIAERRAETIDLSPGARALLPSPDQAELN